ncbi:MFS transporter [Bacillus thermotolerans]|uniref:MFS transporter n=1 Tax=Bacillus thermotolerans TaxID=1221996 RepID=UPI0005890BAC|nr:MFS transporter [Bacillus thermotolerans]KKB33306.1 Macrolide-efflux protein [Bacillus thermotolerans]
MKDFRSFLILWIGQTFSNLGDIFYLVGIISYLYTLSNSVFLVSLIPFVITFSRFLGGMLAPLVLDKFNLKEVIVSSSFGKTFLLLILLLSVHLTDGVHSLMFIIPVVSVIAFLDGWHTPARNAMIPQLAGEEKLVKANSLLSITDRTIQLSGWPVGAIIVAIYSGQYLITFTLFLFIVSSLLMLFVKYTSTKERSESSPIKLWDSLKQGWQYIWNAPTLVTISVMDAVNSIAGAVWIAAILYVYVDEILNKGEEWWGYINSFFFAGLLIGGILSLKLDKFYKDKKHYLIICGSLFTGLFTFWFGFPFSPIVALIISFLVGLPTQVQEIAQLSLIQSYTPQNILPKVFSARDTIFTGLFGIFALLFGAISELYGVRSVFVISSLLLLFSSVWAYKRRRYLALETSN